MTLQLGALVAAESGQDPQIFAQYRVWNPECLMAVGTQEVHKDNPQLRRHQTLRLMLLQVRPVQPKFRSQRDETQWQLVNEVRLLLCYVCTCFDLKLQPRTTCICLYDFTAGRSSH